MRLRPELLIALGLASLDARAADLDLRLKAFGSHAMLPDEDIQRASEGTPAQDGSVDARAMFAQQTGGWRWIAELDTVYQVGDSYGFNNAPQGTLDQTPSDDDSRFMDLTWTLDDGDRHRVYQRLDRLALSYRGANWGVTVGRQAVSWGSGLVFQPLDLFSPFAPTTVDRDYKPGDDVVMFDRLNDNETDLQLLAVLRRDAQGNRDAAETSVGGKFHALWGERDLDFVVGRHYRDAVFGVSLRMPVGTALLRTDWLVTDLEEGGTKVSGIVNLDYSFDWMGKSWYVFAEYFRNGFGVSREPVDITRLPSALTTRLARGELFTLMKDYTALGMQIQWHPLIMHSLSVITNLHDTSSLLQTSVSYDAGDAMRYEAGVVAPLGAPGDEYGGVEATAVRARRTCVHHGGCD
ncbi:MAG: hypothetical protein HC809_08855, partial [Gammaproteobacteria bacterium]|nr:hypothetical protein [Gammaproteobacteria bacterium]